MPAPRIEFPLQLQADLPCPVPWTKRIHFACRANHNYKPARPAPLPRGASPSSRNVGRGMRWTLQLKRRMSLKRTAKPRGPGAPWLASSWRRCFCIAPMTVTNTSRTPGRARRKPLKPIACGNAGCIRWTCGDYTRVLSHFGREAAGAIAHPAFSTPSKRGGSAQGSGVLRREIAQP